MLTRIVAGGMTSGNMSKRAIKKNDGYPRVSLRIDPDLLARVNELREKSGLSFGQIFSQAVRRFLPELEKFHDVKKAA